MDNKYFFVGVTIVAIIVIGIILSIPQDTQTKKQSSDSNKVMITQGIKHTIPLDDIKNGGPPPDGIPSIDKPKFVNSSQAQFLKDDDLVIGLRLNGETKAYPLFILVWHEIVNDKFGNVPVAVTYCPLCFTTQVFERILNGTEVQFGTSGKLYNSNLVMYDRSSGSYWSQALGESIEGPFAGTDLKKIPFDVARWSDWKLAYPDSLVLTTDTGFQRPYGSDPYGDYYTSNEIIFPISHTDDRMHSKEKIVGLERYDHFKAYKISDIESSKIINDKVGESKILLVSPHTDMTRAFDRKINDQVLDFIYSNGKITDTKSNSEWNFEGQAISGAMKGEQLQRLALNPGFWFEWAAFHPNTEIYSG